MSDILKRQLDGAVLPCRNCHAVPLVCLYDGFIYLECPECRRRSTIESSKTGSAGRRSYLEAEERAIKNWNLRN